MIAFFIILGYLIIAVLAYKYHKWLVFREFPNSTWTWEDVSNNIVASVFWPIGTVVMTALYIEGLFGNGKPPKWL